VRQYREAGQAFRQAFDRDPDNLRILTDLADYLADCPDPDCRHPAEAVELAAKAVARAPEDGTVWATLGVANYRAGNGRQAVAALERSVELRNGNANGVEGFFLVMASWQAGDREPARERFARLARWMDQSRPNDEDLRRVRAEAAGLLGQAATPSHR
jgi:predicted Zn-dependent protease